MIYLIDDKHNRQVGLGWTREKFDLYKGYITPIYSYEEITANNNYLKKAIFSEDNVILFHESFFDNIENRHRNESLEIRNDLYSYTKENKSRLLVIFSGSKSNRVVEDNVANIPVSVLYHNLESFITRIKENKHELRHLLYGTDPAIEEFLIEKNAEANKVIDEIGQYEVNSRNLVIKPNKGYIQNPLPVSCYDEVLIINKVEDADFSNKTIEWLSKKQYTNIFIPLCFGPTLSDFNGLRFAAHIRTTLSINQLTNIYIYSFVDYSYLLDNEYFNILKTKNVKLIDYKRSAFENAVKSQLPPLTNEELPSEIKKLNLKPPSNYEDNHSITNEWSIYRWASTINTDDEAINKIIHRVKNNLYFKYLSTIYPITKCDILSDNTIKINLTGQPKILYIDDEAEKGWHKIFCKILYDVNKIEHFHYICDELRSLNQNEIITLCIDKVKEKDIDVVILDFRLHPDDFQSRQISNVTGYRILEEIKKFNPGIQVIIFSATNKALNLQALQNIGSDGFILKESPENSSDANFTMRNIKNFIHVLELSTKKCFLKDFYLKLDTLKQELYPRTNYKKSPDPLPKDFVDEVVKWLELSYDLLGEGISNKNLTAAFLFLFSVLENLSNRIIDTENPIPVAERPGMFKFEFRSNKARLRSFVEDKTNLGYYRKTNTVLKSNRSLPWIYKILNALDFICDEKFSESELNLIVRKRNDIIHANSTIRDKIVINTEIIVKLNKIIHSGLINVK